MSTKLLIVFAAVLQVSLGQLEVPGKLLTRRSELSIAPIAFPTGCTGSSIYSTCSGCSKVLVCAGTFQNERDCSTNTSAPYCSGGECSPVPNFGESDCELPDMKCTDVGFFPDPKTCQLYHYCEKVGEQSSVYGCQPGYVFNVLNNNCKQKKLTSDCVTVKCDSSNLFGTYGNSKTYFAYCDTTTGDIEMFKCAAYSTFTGTNCAFTCPREGNFAKSLDQHHYFQCYLSGGKLVYADVACQGTKIFNATLGVCVEP